MKKLAIIRSETGSQCPFGLSIDLACQCAGKSVLRMTALESVPEERKQLQLDHNVAVYALDDSQERCIFADKILDSGAVQCDWNEPGAGITDVPVPAISVTPRIYQPGGLTGYYSYPLWEYASSMADLTNGVVEHNPYYCQDGETKPEDELSKSSKSSNPGSEK